MSKKVKNLAAFSIIVFLIIFNALNLRSLVFEPNKTMWFLMKSELSFTESIQFSLLMIRELDPGYHYNDTTMLELAVMYKKLEFIKKVSVLSDNDLKNKALSLGIKEFKEDNEYIDFLRKELST